MKHLEVINKEIKKIFKEKKCYYDYLKIILNFSNYSYINTILIYLQNSDAKIVAGAKAFKKALNAEIKENESGIIIIVPQLTKKNITNNLNALKEKKINIKMLDYKTVQVFDIKQTNIDHEDLSLLKKENIILSVDLLRKKIDYGIYFVKESDITSTFTKSIMIDEQLSNEKKIKEIIKEYFKRKIFIYELRDVEKELIIDSITYIVLNYFKIEKEFLFNNFNLLDIENIDKLKEILKIIHYESSTFLNLINSDNILFSFEETFIINLLLTNIDKYLFIQDLIQFEKNTDIQEIKDSINTLIKKIEILSLEDIKKMYNDKISYKTTYYPQYFFKKA